MHILTIWHRHYKDGVNDVQVTCPKCKADYWLDHKISSDGMISPSLECPTETCTFHEACKLEGWVPNA